MIKSSQTHSKPRSNKSRIPCLVIGIAIVIGLISLALPLTIQVFFNQTSFRVRMNSFSMEPAVHRGSYLWVDKLAYLKRPPRRGDIILYSSPSIPNLMNIHRVIGLPGEIVSIDEGGVSINGVKLNEPYILKPAVYTGQWSLGDGEYFVLGDNRNDSSDSHLMGSLPFSDIKGKVVWMYWPPKVWGKPAEISYPP